MPQVLVSRPAGLAALTAFFFLSAGLPGLEWLSVTDYLASFTAAPGIISLLMFVLFAAMPTLASQPRRGRTRISPITR